MSASLADAPTLLQHSLMQALTAVLKQCSMPLRMSWNATDKVWWLRAGQGRGRLGSLRVRGCTVRAWGFAGHELNDMHRCDLGTRTWDCPDCCTGAQSCVFTPLHELPSSKLLSQAACASMTSSEMSTVARALLVARHTGASESQGLTM